jgi:hypothetical protein
MYARKKIRQVIKLKIAALGLTTAMEEIFQVKIFEGSCFANTLIGLLVSKTETNP